MFTNPQENRLRMAWRVILFLMAFLLIQFIFGVVAIAGAVALNVGLGLSSQQVLLEQLSTTPEAVPGLAAIASITVGIGTVVVMALFARFIDRRRFTDYTGHIDRDWWLDLGFGLLLGAVLMAAIFGVELLLGWVTITDTVTTARPSFLFGLVEVVLLYLAVGIYEELFSRGYLLRNLAEGFTPGMNKVPAVLVATLLSSIVFGALHYFNPNATLLSTFNIVLAGFMLAAGYVLTGKLAIPIGLHITWNFFQGVVFGFPVSGTDTGTSLVAIEQGGPALLTGGAFGPEAGLIGIAAMIIGTALTAMYVHVRYGRADIHTELTEPTLLPHPGGDEPQPIGEQGTTPAR